MRILVVNAGSSSLKLALLDASDAVLDAVTIDAPGGAFNKEAAASMIAEFGRSADAVGHRVVHGGGEFTDAVLATPSVRDRLETFVTLAPLHQPAALKALELSVSALPRHDHFCCFDTGFHATLPQAATTYAVPRRWREDHGVRKFGFHGLSHAYVARRLGFHERIVSCHLGAGASLCAVRNGASIDTTMGFTPLGGLVMATRPGDLDPGVIVWALQRGADPGTVARELHEDSGLQGLCGTGDMRAVLARATEGEPAAALALDVVLHRLIGAAGSMTAALGGLDCLVFTGGVGEHAAELRARVASGLAFLGVAIDEELNSQVHGSGRDVTAAGASVHTEILAAREDIEIAAQGRELLFRKACLQSRPAALARLSRNS